MDIVDAQIHLGLDQIDATLATMDALGIQSVLIDEYWGRSAHGDIRNFEPGFRLPNGAWRTLAPTAEIASALHPERFSYLVRVDRSDPDLESVLRLVSTNPHARAVRTLPVWTLEEARAFADGAYDRLFALAQELALPVFLFVPGFVELLPPHLKKFPRLTFVVDHCGMAQPGIPAGRSPDEIRRVESLTYFDEVLRLAEYPNVALKWSHAQAKFQVHDYPYRAIQPFLRKAIAAFGPERILWASDHTVIPEHSWSDMLHYLRDDSDLSTVEKEWILGGTARKILKWLRTE